MNVETLNELYEPVTKKERQGPGNKMYEYTPSQDVIDRMNKTFKGNWSTHVACAEILEDQVLVRVTVEARDPRDNNGYSYSHDGFGSSLIARYSYGDNKGKAMDIGNIYKSAEAKAIVNACKRFGVSLLDTDSEDTTTVTIPDGFIGHETAPAPAPNSVLFAEPTTTPGVLDMSRVEYLKASMPVMSMAPKKTESVAPVIPTTVHTPDTITTAPPIEFTSGTPLPPQTPPKLAGHLEPNKPGTVSDVQMAALTGFVELKGFNYQDLSQSAFMQAGLPIDAIPEKEGLSYNQAVIIIKHGNEKQRQNM
jgi:hypothetical protein